MTRRSCQREPNFHADENFRAGRNAGRLFLSPENWGHFGTVIVLNLIKNRLLFCRKCPSMKFGLRGTRANVMSNNQIYSF